MKAEEAKELSKTFTEINRYRAFHILNEIYFQIRKCALTRVNYLEYYQPWNKNAGEDDRKAIMRSIIQELKGNGYTVLTEAEKGKFVRLRIWW